MHAIGAMLAVSELSGRLEPAGAHLRALLPRNCPNEVRAAIQEHKARLLVLLRLEFVAVRSAVLNEIVFFAADESAKAALLSAGAERECIYTANELRELVKQHRRAPLTADDLLRLHAAKRIFKGRVYAQADE